MTHAKSTLSPARSSSDGRAHVPASAFAKICSPASSPKTQAATQGSSYLSGSKVVTVQDFAAGSRLGQDVWLFRSR
eukprot:1791239-Pleurochrysis_carterae.AAC.1